MRTFLTTVVALVLLPAVGSAQAQSETSGLMLGAHLNGSAISADESDDIESGGGLGLSLGWGFTPSFMLYATATSTWGPASPSPTPSGPGCPSSRPPSAAGPPSGTI